MPSPSPPGQLCGFSLAIDLRLRFRYCLVWGSAKMRTLGIDVLGAALGGCSITLPVAVISKN